MRPRSCQRNPGWSARRCVARGIGIQQGADVAHVHAGAELIQGADRAAEFFRQQALHSVAEMPGDFVDLFQNQTCRVLAAAGQVARLIQGHGFEKTEDQAHIHLSSRSPGAMSSRMKYMFRIWRKRILSRS